MNNRIIMPQRKGWLDPCGEWVGDGYDAEWNAALDEVFRLNAAAPAPAGWVPVTERYTCIGKGGSYELIGRADCAGTLRHTGRFTDEVIVYRDIESGNLYCRAPGDFMVRMEKLPAAPSAECEA